MVTRRLRSKSSGCLLLSEPMYLERRAFFKETMAGDIMFFPFRHLRMDKMPAIAEWPHVYTYLRWWRGLTL